jgi:hypothetical protein
MRMDQTEFVQHMQHLRLLKGCPLSVLHALNMARDQRMGAVGAIWLESATGYSEKPIMEALNLLESWGQVERIRRCNWALVKNPSMLPLVIGLGKMETLR